MLKWFLFKMYKLINLSKKYFKLILIFPILIIFNIINAQTPSNPKFVIPPVNINKLPFQDLLKAGPELKKYDLNFDKESKKNLEKNSLFQEVLISKNTYKRRYLEKDWQDLYEIERDNKTSNYTKNLLLKKSLEEQFSLTSYDSFKNSKDISVKKESATRRFNIIFFLSLPLTSIYTLGFISLYKISQNQNIRANSNDLLISVSIGAICSSIIAWKDYKKNKTLNINNPEGFSF